MRVTGLITVSISLFGEDGPQSKWPATDFTLVAASGKMICNGEANRQSERDLWYLKESGGDTSP
ncbi:uncharacterized protein METZ01_LOCUS207104 [marine metagenome]|uniref:Uncharacterized protein n=1 Tax=marine metagenome TaxID=408172 RepID=A0A382EU60_9ZZZZ